LLFVRLTKKRPTGLEPVGRKRMGKDTQNSIRELNPKLATNEKPGERIAGFFDDSIPKWHKTRPF